MTEVPHIDVELPAESQACLQCIPGVKQLQNFINRLDGGYSGAQLWQIRFRRTDTSTDQIGILKLGLAEDISKEIQKHQEAIATLDHPPMPSLLAEGQPVEGWQAIVFSVAPDVLWRAQKLATCVRLSRGKEALEQLSKHLAAWYTHHKSITQTGFKYIRSIHNSALTHDAEELRKIAQALAVNVDHGQVIFEGEEKGTTLPNPFHLLFYQDAFAVGCQNLFSAPFGPVHGDLHLGNIMVSQDGTPTPILIDFALFEPMGSIMHDLAHLELSLALEHLNPSVVEQRRLWERLFGVGWFAAAPTDLPTELIGTWQQMEEIRRIVLVIAGADPGIQEEYKTAYLFAVASDALRWVRFDNIPLQKRLGTLYASAQALHALEARGFVQRLEGLSRIAWRPLPQAVSVIEQERMEKARQWFRMDGKQALQDGRGVLIVGPDLAQSVTRYCEADLAEATHTRFDGFQSSYDPAWAEALGQSEQGEKKRSEVCKLLSQTKVESEGAETLVRVPWQAVFDWSQVPALFYKFDCTLQGLKRVYRLFPQSEVDEGERLGPARMPWIAIRGAPDPPDCMVWGDDWIDVLSKWKRRLANWSSQPVSSPIVIGVGLAAPMKDDVWAMVMDIFAGQALLVNVSHPIESGRPIQRALARRIVDLDLTPKQWLELIAEFFPPSLVITKEESADRNIVFRIPKSRKPEQEQEELKHLSLTPEEAIRLGEYFEFLTDGSGRGTLPEGRSLGDVYRGYPVLYQEIRAGYPITRDCEGEILKSIQAELEIGNPRRLHLYHEPGAGASVLVRQIAWKLYNEWRVPVLILNHFHSAEVIERLRDFWYRVDRSFVVIVEEEYCLPDQWDTIQLVLQQEQIPAIVLIVSRRATSWIRQNLRKGDEQMQDASSRRFFLLDELGQREIQDLQSQLELFFKSSAKKRLQEVHSRSMFATMFSVFEGDFSAHGRIIRGLIRDVSEMTARLLKTLAFFRLYGDTPWVPSDLLTRLSKVDVGTSLEDTLSDFFDRIVIQRGQGAASVWAVSHHLIAEDLLANLLVEEHQHE